MPTDPSRTPYAESRSQKEVSALFSIFHASPFAPYAESPSQKEVSALFATFFSPPPLNWQLSSSEKPRNVEKSAENHLVQKKYAQPRSAGLSTRKRNPPLDCDKAKCYIEFKFAVPRNGSAARVASNHRRHKKKETDNEDEHLVHSRKLLLLLCRQSAVERFCCNRCIE